MTSAPVPFRLSLPAAEAALVPALFTLFKKAPMFLIDVEEGESVFLALFPHLRESVEQVLELVGTMKDMPDIHLRVNGMGITDPVRVWQALQCYRESLGYADPSSHCAKMRRCVDERTVCASRDCPVRCPFMQSACGGTTETGSRTESRVGLEKLARRAEVDWCPNMKVSLG